MDVPRHARLTIASDREGGNKEESVQVEERVRELLGRMTLEEKVGQMCQVTGGAEEHKELAQRGLVGSILNVTQSETPDRARVTNEFQSAAVKGTRLGIPLLIARDVIHGFRTVMPIPLGQAASFDIPLVEEAAATAAREAAACGIRWTFAPMVDIARDARWGRIAEGGGEDPLLTSRLGAAMVRGFQGSDPADAERVAACAKHYVGYGAAEGGRDYNTTWIPESLLRNVYLPPFRACVDAGALTVMSAFNDLNGVPTSGNPLTLRQILKTEWDFQGLVVSDWNSVAELVPHGLCSDERDAARAAVTAGVDMDMVGGCYAEHLVGLVENGAVPVEVIDEAAGRILGVKFRLGLFDAPYSEEARSKVILSDAHREVAKRIAIESCVLIKNDGALPMAGDVRSLAVIGPLADAPVEQLGCWTLDGRAEDTVTPLRALEKTIGGRCDVRYAAGLPDARSGDTAGIEEARRLASDCDAVVLCLGEDAGLSGEAHCRAFLGLPGAQEQLVAALSDVGRAIIGVIMAGRPLVLTGIVEHVDALLVAWHPGTMGGPALADILLGAASPSGRLPASFPRTTGQAPIYYAHKNTGRPAPAGNDVVPVGTPLDPESFFSAYLDVHHSPLFPFGYGLSYGAVSYSDLRLSAPAVALGETLGASVTITNDSAVAVDEVVQLYVRDPVASLTRPVKELKHFMRVRLGPGESREVSFRVSTDQLAFHNSAGERVVEPGVFHIMIGGNSEEVLTDEFVVRE
jgi:beta-glucosidase